MVAYVGALFVGRMLAQTGGAWSAPVDATFVQFDVARAAARGFPLQWSEGNGLSTVDGSLTYPLVLALGYRTAWAGSALMAWAVGVAAVSLLGFFLALARVFDRVGRGAKYAIPPLVLGVGDVASSLASGGENALVLGLFGAALAATMYVEAGATAKRSKTPPWMSARSLLAGVVCMALVLTRPEAIVAVVALAVFAALRSRPLGGTTAFGIGAILALPALLALGVVALVGFDRTGEWLPTGRVAHWLVFDPALSAAEKWRAWASNLAHLPGAISSEMFGGPAYVAIPAVFAALAFVDARVRRYAVLLAAIVVAWMPAVALAPKPSTDASAIPPVALFLVLAALGAAIAAGPFGETTRARAMWGVRTSVVALLFLAFEGRHLARYRELERVYARDARALLEGPAAAGALLANADPLPKRVLVTSPGAVAYVADRPAIDASGVGTYRDFPFARARRAGIGAVLELVERLPDVDRPDVLTLAASDAPELLLLFGRYINEVRAGTDGERWLIYRADWHALDRANRPRSLAHEERIVAQVDVADLWSEREQSYRTNAGRAGAVSFHVLNDSDREDLFDAGRAVDAGVTESVDVDLPIGGGRLVTRSAALKPARVRVVVDGRDVGEIEIGRSDAWSEPSVELPIGLPRHGRVELTPDAPWVDYHLWVIATP